MYLNLDSVRIPTLAGGLSDAVAAPVYLNVDSVGIPTLAGAFAAPVYRKAQEC